jgi:hypothetical protein
MEPCIIPFVRVTNTRSKIMRTFALKHANTRAQLIDQGDHLESDRSPGERSITWRAIDHPGLILGLVQGDRHAVRVPSFEQVPGLDRAQLID